MSEVIAYKITQIVDNGNVIQMTLVEDVQTEPLSQKQLIPLTVFLYRFLESVNYRI